MRRLWAVCAATLVTLLGGAAHAQQRVDYTFTFDSAPAGTPVNALAPEELFVRFFPAVFAPDQDEFGDVIPGTQTWRIDPAAPPLIVGDPSTYGRGAAPSPANALDALLQPVLIAFDPAFYPGGIDRFSLALDNDPFGDVLPILFYDQSDAQILRLDIDQRVPGLLVNPDLESLKVQKVVLPAGAFYDNVRFSGVAVPEPGTAALAVSVAAPLLGFAGRRRNRKK